MTINNMPEYAANYDYIVYRTVDGEDWFYGAYETVDQAVDVAIEVDGMVYCKD